MTDDTTTAAATETGQANGKTDAKPRPQRATATKAEPDPVKIVTGKPDGECEGCDEPGKGAVGLGLLICAVAGGLLYIGLDLVTGGGLSRKFAGAREDEDE